MLSELANPSHDAVTKDGAAVLITSLFINTYMPCRLADYFIGINMHMIKTDTNPHLPPRTDQ